MSIKHAAIGAFAVVAVASAGEQALHDEKTIAHKVFNASGSKLALQPQCITDAVNAVERQAPSIGYPDRYTLQQVVAALYDNKASLTPQAYTVATGVLHRATTWYNRPLFSAVSEPCSIALTSRLAKQVRVGLN